MRILYVENHRVFAEGVRQQFLAEHEVTIVESLAAARQALKLDTFDLLLVDYDLDDGKGDELVRALRDTGDKVPVVAASSHQAGNVALLKAGASVVCSKMDFDNIRR